MKAIQHRKLIKKLTKMGATRLRDGKGSHEIYELNGALASIPMHRIVAPGTLRDICKLLKVDASRLFE